MSPIDQLKNIMQRLRDPETGCPWDIKQNFSTIAPYTIEEAYEVYEAIEAGDLNDLKEELGDLLLQVIFHSQIAAEQNAFTFDDVTETISEKMIRRHPHIFKDEAVTSADQVNENWETIKERERAKKGKDHSVLNDIPAALPALTRAQKITKRAARVGFDWTEAADIFDKIEEEIAELKLEIHQGSAKDRLEDELGDLLFCMANLGRHLSIEPEEALRRANAKFTKRFQAMENSFAQANTPMNTLPLDIMEAKWQQVKKEVG